MRAIVIRELDGPSAARLEDLPEPLGAHPMADGVRLLVEVHAAGVSFPDLLQSRGEYQLKPPLPYVSGGEIAGVVREAAPDSGFSVGDRVAGMTVWGALAEFALAIPRYTVKLPDNVSFIEGSALYLNSVTAWFAIERANVEAGETVLVQGAAGGVGTAALEILRAIGARPVAVVSSDEKERVALDAGADAVVRATADWLTDVRELTDGHGVDVVLDPVGGDRFTDSLRSLDIGGRLVVIGFAGGEIPQVKVNRLLHRNLTVLGISMDPMEHRFPGTVRRLNDAVVELAAEGKIHPPIGHRMPLENGGEALQTLDRRETLGNVVVEVISEDGSGRAA
jgi:NADPH2:quinone reductase